MKRNRRVRLPSDETAVDPDMDDGIDPGTFFDSHRSESRPDVRTLRLCGEVAKAVSLWLGIGCRDAVLQTLGVRSVTPAPNAARLKVTVYPADPGVALDPAVVLGHLQRARGALTMEVASSIQRKRAPELIFEIALDEVEP